MNASELIQQQADLLADTALKVAHMARMIEELTDKHQEAIKLLAQCEHDRLVALHRLQLLEPIVEKYYDGHVWKGN